MPGFPPGQPPQGLAFKLTPHGGRGSLSIRKADNFRWETAWSSVRNCSMDPMFGQNRETEVLSFASVHLLLFPVFVQLLQFLVCREHLFPEPSADNAPLRKFFVLFSPGAEPVLGIAETRAAQIAAQVLAMAVKQPD